MKAIIVIPVYKKEPDKFEILSLRRCLKILGKHTICLLTPATLDLSQYQAIFGEMSGTFITEHFDDAYFKSQKGYNQLLLTREFYERFQSWNYMLIYQLDAYVFSDQLKEWCEKGYDYIGAPWCKLNQTIDWNNSGNGGFSLRFIPAFIRIFSHTGNVLNLQGLWNFHRYRGPLHRTPLAIKGLFGVHNRLADYTDGLRVNEDLFFASLKHCTRKPFKVPDSKVAMHFAFEEKPSYLYAKTGKLPFGCHAFLKNEYDTFYKPLIEKDEK